MPAACDLLSRDARSCLGHRPACLSMGCRPSDPRPPDVLVFLVDTLRADHLDHFGYERETAPNLAAFSRDAVTYERAYAPSSWTKPSTASLLTGLDPLEHGAITGSDRIDPEAAVLGGMLRRQGYYTVGISANPTSIRPGGSIVGSTASSTCLRLLAPRTSSSSCGPTGCWRRRSGPRSSISTPSTPTSPTSRPIQRDPWPSTTPSSCGRPLRSTPHRTRTRSRRPSTLTTERSLTAIESSVDLDEFRARGRYEGMLIVYASDHGEEFLDHGRAGHQQTLYEEVVRVPLLVKFPGNDFGGQRVSDPTSLLDVVPTILAAVGTEPPAELQGVDLRKVVTRATREERVLFFDLDRRGRGDASFRMQAVLRGRYKLIRSSSPREQILLYDIEDDPLEENDLSFRSPDVVEQLSGLLDEWSLRAAEGIHLVVANESDVTDRQFRGRFETEGRFVDVLGRGLEDGDRIELDEEARSVAFDFTTHNRPNPAWPPPEFLVDQDGLSFRLEPDDAALVVAEFEAQGFVDPSLVLGGSRREIRSLPLVLSGAETELDVSAGAFRASTSADPRGQLRGLACLMRVRQAAETAADEALGDRLRALGY